MNQHHLKVKTFHFPPIQPFSFLSSHFNTSHPTTSHSLTISPLFSRQNRKNIVINTLILPFIITTIASLPHFLPANHTHYTTQTQTQTHIVIIINLHHENHFISHNMVNSISSPHSYHCSWLSFTPLI